MDAPKDSGVNVLHEKNGIKEVMTRIHTGQLPEYYVKPMIERLGAEESVSSEQLEVPCIDLTALSSESLLGAINQACTEWGFFYLINHGISPTLLRQMELFGMEFFSLPVEEKVKSTTSDGRAGAIHFGGGGNRDWREILKFNCSPESIVNKELWPLKPEGARQLLEEYSWELYELGWKLLKMISRSLGLEKSYILEACGHSNMKTSITINHQPPSLDPSLTMGHRTHSDPNMLTILYQDDVGGLQIYHKDKWVEAKPLRNAFIVNVGDQLQILSNGKYNSSLHRVVSNGHRARTSTAFFLAPTRDRVIGPAPALTDKERPALYPHMLYGDYLDEFYRQSDSPVKLRYLAGLELHEEYNSYSEENRGSP